jgi:hypothetical protein
MGLAYMWGVIVWLVILRRVPVVVGLVFLARVVVLVRRLVRG